MTDAEIAKLVGWPHRANEKADLRWGESLIWPQQEFTLWKPTTDANHLIQALEMRWPGADIVIRMERSSGSVSVEVWDVYGDEEIAFGGGATLFIAGCAALAAAGPKGESDGTDS